MSSVPRGTHPDDYREGIEFDTEQMLGWWKEYTAEAGERTVPKAIEYGSSDLKIMGAAMAELFGLEGIDEAERNLRGQQAAIAFYMQGKIGRIISSLADGKPIPEDHEFDIFVYAVMLRRLRLTGQWP